MNYIKVISNASDRRGNLLIELMDKFHAQSLREITQEQALQYCIEHNLTRSDDNEHQD